MHFNYFKNARKTSKFINLLLILHSFRITTNQFSPSWGLSHIRIKFPSHMWVITQIHAKCQINKAAAANVYTFVSLPLILFLLFAQSNAILNSHVCKRKKILKDILILPPPSSPRPSFHCTYIRQWTYESQASDECMLI